jgi:predicted site-specific integrase-resolvase
MNNGTEKETRITIPIREVCKYVGVQSRTIREWNKQNVFETFKTPSGQTRYFKDSVERVIGKIHDTPSTTKKCVVYARVSSKKQSDDLERQIQFLKSKYPEHHVITDIGSGLNFKKKGLKTLLEWSTQGIIQEIVVAHKDRLCRFGFELLESIVNLNGGRIVVLDAQNSAVGKSSEQELAEDILSIIHIYSCRQMGKRKYRKGREIDSDTQDQDLSNKRTAEQIEAMDGNSTMDME